MSKEQIDPNDEIAQIIKEIRTKALADGIDPAYFDQFAQVMSSAARARGSYDPEYFKRWGDLFHTRPEIAKKLVDNVVNLGNRSGEKVVDLQGKVGDALISTQQLATASKVELDKSYQEPTTRWGGFWLAVGKFCSTIPGLQGFSAWCLQTAEGMQPQSIIAETKPLEETRKNIKMDAGRAADTATSVLEKALDMTDLSKFRYGKKELVGLHEQTDAAREAVATEAPARFKQVPKNLVGTVSTATPAAAAVANLDALASDVAAKMAQPSKTKDGKDVAAVTNKAAIENAVIAADTKGNNDGQWNDGKEFQQSKAYKALDEAQKAKINGMLGIDAAGNIVKPVEGLDKEKVSSAPVPAGMAYHHS